MPKDAEAIQRFRDRAKACRLQAAATVDRVARDFLLSVTQADEAAVSALWTPVVPKDVNAIQRCSDRAKACRIQAAETVDPMSRAFLISVAEADEAAVAALSSRGRTRKRRQK